MLRSGILDCDRGIVAKEKWGVVTTVTVQRFYSLMTPVRMDLAASASATSPMNPNLFFNTIADSFKLSEAMTTFLGIGRQRAVLSLSLWSFGKFRIQGLKFSG